MNIGPPNIDASYATASKHITKPAITALNENTRKLRAETSANAKTLNARQMYASNSYYKNICRESFNPDIKVTDKVKPKYDVKEMIR